LRRLVVQGRPREEETKSHHMAYSSTCSAVTNPPRVALPPLLKGEGELCQGLHTQVSQCHVFRFSGNLEETRDGTRHTRTRANVLCR
jgi:hypothetical protein